MAAVGSSVCMYTGQYYQWWPVHLLSEHCVIDLFIYLTTKNFLQDKESVFYWGSVMWGTTVCIVEARVSWMRSIQSDLGSKTVNRPKWPPKLKTSSSSILSQWKQQQTTQYNHCCEAALAALLSSRVSKLLGLFLYVEISRMPWRRQQQAVSFVSACFIAPLHSLVPPF